MIASCTVLQPIAVLHVLQKNRPRRHDGAGDIY
jgi:hypothetical protein